MLNYKLLTGALFAAGFTIQSASAQVFSEDFENAGNWYVDKQIQWDADWIGVNNNNGARSNGAGALSSLFSWRGAANTTSGGSLGVGDSFNIQFDFKWELNGATSHGGYVFGVTNDVTQTGATHMGPLNASNSLGTKLEYNMYPGPTAGQPTTNGTIKMLGYEGASNGDSLLTTAESFGFAPQDTTNPDFVGDTMRVSYTATKSATANEFLVDIEVTNLDTRSVYSKLGVVASNETIYNASDLYFGFASKDGNSVATSTLDNISFTVVPEPGTYALLAGLAALSFVAIRRRK